MELITERDRIYAENEAGGLIAEVTFPEKDGVQVIDHTFVDPSLRGQGAAAQLVQAAAEQILKNGNRIGATCSYAVLWFRQHPEYEWQGGGQHAAGEEQE